MVKVKELYALLNNMQIKFIILGLPIRIVPFKSTFFKSVT